MRPLSRDLAFLLIGFAMSIGCAATFPYRNYNALIRSRSITQADVGKDIADLVYDEGVLLGKLGNEGWVDKPLSECKPDAGNKFKCSVMFLTEFNNLKTDDLRCHVDLDSCQHPQPSGK